MPTQYRAVCTETFEHDGAELPLTAWIDSKEEAQAAGKEHEQTTRGHRIRIEEREKPESGISGG